MTDDDIEIVEEDGEGNPKTPEEKIRNLRDVLKRAQMERGEYLDGWQRSKADYVNLKKRSDDDRTTVLQYANQSLVESLLPILDSFEFALLHAGTKGLEEGVSNAISQLLSALESQGVVSYDAVGEIFDPAKHEAVETVAVDDESMDNTVIKVHQKGYTLYGRIIRPARVAIGHYQDVESKH